jgi:hypothetical protein
MLHCTWPTHLIGTDEVTNNGFNMGVFLMATGMGEITNKTIPELKFRSEFLTRLHGDGFYREVDLELWKGLTINASNDSRRKWLSAKKKGMLSSNLYGKPAKEQATIKKQAEARFNLYVAQSEVETCC